MATTYPHLAFDTLAYAQALVSRGFEQKQAEALAVVTRDFVISGQATNEFVDKAIQDAKNEIKQEVRVEIARLENRMTMTTGKMLAFAVGVLLAGIPIIQALLARLG